MHFQSNVATGILFGSESSIKIYPINLKCVGPKMAQIKAAHILSATNSRKPSSGSFKKLADWFLYE